MFLIAAIICRGCCGNLQNYLVLATRSANKKAILKRKPNAVKKQRKEICFSYMDETNIFFPVVILGLCLHHSSVMKGQVK
jgi:hypothetical protein